MDEYIQVGDVGKVNVNFWHIGDDVRVSFYSANNSVYWVSDFANIARFRDALKQRHYHHITERRFFAEMMWDTDGVSVKSGDILFSSRPTITRLNNQQIAELVTYLDARLAQGFTPMPDDVLECEHPLPETKRVDEPKRGDEATRFWQRQWRAKRPSV